MAGTISNFSSILKEFYLGPIQDSLNNEVHILELFEKMKVDWNGKHAIIPIHVSRNSGVAFRAESGASSTAANANLPDATQQGYVNLQITAKYLYGRFQVTGPAMAATGKGGNNTFISWMDSEMNGLVRDVKNHANRTFISGNLTLGFIIEKKATGSNDSGSFTSWTFVGDITKFEQVARALEAQTTNIGNYPVGTSAGALEVDIIRLDTYATLATNVRVNATIGSVVDVANSTISLEDVQNGAAGVGDTQWTTDALGTATSSVPCAVVISANQSDAGTRNAWVDDYISTEPYGVYHNLAFPSLHGADRTDAAGSTGLQSNWLVQGDSEEYVLEALTLVRMQIVMDNIANTSDEAPNLIMMSPLQRQNYAALFQLTAAGAGSMMTVSGERATSVDGGVGTMSYGGVPIKTSRHVDDGLMLFLNTKSWKVLELESGGFADLDGEVLSRVSDRDSWEGFYKWYYQLVCTRPNANGVLLGLTKGLSTI
jgi:hypothetical protein